jgi:hypothetical protein
VFDDPEERDSHIISRGMTEREPYEDRPFHDETALPWKRALADAFRAHVSKPLSLEGQWFSLWRIVFPGVDPPASCLVDDDAICEYVLEYYEFTAARGAEVIRQVIRAHGLLPGTETHEMETGRDGDGNNLTATAAQLQTFAERVYGLAAETIFRDWASQRQSSTTHAAVRHGHGHGQHRPPIETNDQGDRRLALPTAQTAPDATNSHRGAITEEEEVGQAGVGGAYDILNMPPLSGSLSGSLDPLHFAGGELDIVGVGLYEDWDRADGGGGPSSNQNNFFQGWDDVDRGDDF